MIILYFPQINRKGALNQGALAIVDFRKDCGFLIPKFAIRNPQSKGISLPGSSFLP